MSISTSPTPLLASSAPAKPIHHMHPHSSATNTSSSGHHQHQQRSPIQQHHSTHTHHHLQSLSHSSSPNMLPREGSQASLSSLPTSATSTAITSSNTLASLSSMLANTLQENELLRADLSAALNRAAKAERLVKAFQSAASSSEESCSKGSNAGTGTGNGTVNSPGIGTKNNDNTNNNDGYDISQCGYLSENTVNIIMDYDERLEKSERSQEYLHQKLHSLLSSWSELERYLSLIEIRAQDARVTFGKDVITQMENGVGGFRFGFGESSGAVVGQRDKDRDKDINGQGLSLPLIPPLPSATSKYANIASGNASSSFGSLTLPPIFPGSNSNSQSQSQSRPNSSQLLPPSPFAHNQRSQYEHGSQSSSSSQRRSHPDSLQLHQHHSHPPPLQLQPLHGGTPHSSAPNTGSGYWTSAPNAFQALPLPPPPSATVGPNPSNNNRQGGSGATAGVGQKRSYDDVTGVNADVDATEEMDGAEMQIRQGRKRSRRERGVDYSSSPASGQLQQQLYSSQPDNVNGMLQIPSTTNGIGNGVGGGRQHMYANPPVSRERTIILAHQQIQSMEERDTQARRSRHKEKISKKDIGLPINGQHTRGRDASKDTRRSGRGRSLSVSSQAESVVSSTSTMSIDEMLLAASGSGSGGVEGNNNTQLLATSSNVGARSGSKRLSPSSSSQLHPQANSPSPYNSNTNGNTNSNERLQAVRPDPHIGPHREPPSVGEYQVHIFAEPVTAAAPPPQSLSATSLSSAASKQRNKPTSTASQARRSRSITSERSLITSTSLPTLPPNPIPPPNVTLLPSGSYPATNDLGQRICRQCGVAGRYKDGKCVEKWGPGPEGPGTVCDRCRKKMKRIAKLGNNEPLSFTQSQSQRSASQSLSQTLLNRQQQPPQSKSQGLRQTQSNPIANSRSSLNISQSLPQQGEVKKKNTTPINKITASTQLPLKRQDTVVVSSESQESVDTRQVIDRRPVMTPPYITSISTKEQHASVGSQERESDDEEGEDLDAEAEVEDDTQVDSNVSSRKGPTQQQRREGGVQSLLSPRTSNVRTPPSANDSMVSVDAEAEPDPSQPNHGAEVQTRVHHAGTTIHQTLPKESQGKEDVEDVDADADAEAENEVDVDDEIVDILPATKYSSATTDKLSVPPQNENSRSRSPPTSNISNRASKDIAIPSTIPIQSSHNHSQIQNVEKDSSVISSVPVLPSIHVAVNGMIKMPSVRGEVKAESS